MHRTRPLVFGLFLILPLAALSAQTVPQTRITQAINDSRLTRLAGNTPPELRHATDLGPVAADFPMQRMQLVLKRGPEQQAALDQYMAEQYEPKSPNFHHWLTPEQFGERYGVSDVDIAAITHWLQSAGFDVNSVSKGRLTIEFSGNAAQVQKAFHTEIHRFLAKGIEHTANQSDPQIPEALAPVITGISSLNNFFAKSQMVRGPQLRRNAKTGGFEPADPSYQRGLRPLTGSKLSPQDTSGSGENTFYYVSPFDFATIYNELPLWTAGLDGTGVTIAVVARSDIEISDVASFRTTFGLPVNAPTILHNGTDPGIPDAGDQGENTLDVEWSGATAPGAKIEEVVSANTNTTDGANLSATYIVDNQLAPILTMSYGLCELSLGAAGNSFYNNLWQQAAAEGISAFVSAGDQGSAACDNSDATAPNAAADGLQVNGIGSTPYNTAVGGTDFGQSNFNNPGTYWNSTNAANGSSAKGYIPEIPWNSTCTNPVVISVVFPGAPAEEVCNAIYATQQDTSLLVTVGGGGGKSACTSPTGSTPETCAGGYAKPTWQTGVGVPADGARDLPDLSLFAANGLLGSSYIFTLNGEMSGVGGTSVSSPAMAGIMALVVQRLGSAQGLANPVLYQLAALQTASSCSSDTVAAGNTCVFNDIVQGNNTVPCITGSLDCVSNPQDTYGDAVGVLSGYNAGTGYDQATGLGSVNVVNLVSGWSTVTGTPAETITLTPTSIPAGNQGSAYYQQITASGGTPPYTYRVSSGSLPAGLALSGSGVLSGIPSGPATSSFSITATDSSPALGTSGSQAYTVAIGAPLTSAGISWLPARLQSYSGLALGPDVLDATDTSAGTFAYTAALEITGAVTVNAQSILAPGSYTLTATFTPTAGGAPSSSSIPFTVVSEHVWTIDGDGKLYESDAAGNFSVQGLPGGGSGIAIDPSGSVWSANVGAASLTEFANTGAIFTGSISGGGLSSSKALAVDGDGAIWVANGNNSVSEFTNDAVPVSPAAGYTGGNLNAPTGIAIDISGSVWIANGGNNSVTEILGAATPVEPVANAVTLGTPGAKP